MLIVATVHCAPQPPRAAPRAPLPPSGSAPCARAASAPLRARALKLAVAQPQPRNLGAQHFLLLLGAQPLLFQQPPRLLHLGVRCVVEAVAATIVANLNRQPTFEPTVPRAKPNDIAVLSYPILTKSLFEFPGQQYCSRGGWGRTGIFLKKMSSFSLFKIVRTCECAPSGRCSLILRFVEL